MGEVGPAWYVGHRVQALPLWPGVHGSPLVLKWGRRENPTLPFNTMILSVFHEKNVGVPHLLRLQ